MSVTAETWDEARVKIHWALYGGDMRPQQVATARAMLNQELDYQLDDMQRAIETGAEIEIAVKAVVVGMKAVFRNPSYTAYGAAEGSENLFKVCAALESVLYEDYMIRGVSIGVDGGITGLR